MGSASAQVVSDEDAIAEVFGDFRAFCSLLAIRRKDGPPIGFDFEHWFAEQRRFDAERTGRDIVLKPRQVGFSTQELARDFWYALTHPGTNVLVVVHHEKIADELFQTAQIFRDALKDAGLLPKTRYSSKKEIVFAPPLNSALRIVESGQTNEAASKKGRSGTIHRLHATEVAFWGAAQETMASVLSCVPATGEVVIESTANGAGGLFYEDVQAARSGRSGYKLHFFPWYQHAEYREPVPDVFDGTPRDNTERRLRDAGCDDEQIAWWRSKVDDPKVGLEKALQEFPSDIDTAFRSAGALWLDAAVLDALATCVRDPMRPAPIVYKGRRFADARMYALPKPGAQYVVGADVSEGIARDGSAATVLDRRTGEIVCTWWDDATPAKDFGAVLAVIGRLYNTALVAPERNNDGKATLAGLSDVANYPSIFHDSDGRAGWNTTPQSRAVLWEDLGYALRSGDALPIDRDIFAECRTIIRDTDGRPRARGKRSRSADACRDDRFVSFAIAWQLLQRAAASTPGRPFRFKGV